MTLTFKIGPVVIEIQADRPPCDEPCPHYPLFVYTGEEPPTLVIRVRSDPPPPRGDAPLTSELATQWQLYAQGDQYRFEALEQIQFQLKQVALINRAFDQVDLYLLPRTSQHSESPQTGWYVEELMNPLIQWWLTAHLAHRAAGMILHGSAVALDGQGLAFIGPSGAGKTTIVQRCQEQAHATILNDDRILLWRTEGGFQVSGTPWSGESVKASPVSVPLVGLFVLAKGKTNRLIQWSSPLQGLRRVIPEAFLPIWSPERMQRLIEAGERLAREVPSGELQFVNDPSVVDYLQGLMGTPHHAVSVEAT